MAHGRYGIEFQKAGGRIGFGHAQTGKLDFHFNQIETAYQPEPSTQTTDASTPANNTALVASPIKSLASNLPAPLSAHTSTVLTTPLIRDNPSDYLSAPAFPSNATAIRANPPSISTITQTAKHSIQSVHATVNNSSDPIWYVATTGSDSNDCATTSTPCTINGAIAKAASGDTIEVALGTYTYVSGSYVAVVGGITLSGGWDSTFTTQNGLSVIDGQNTHADIEVVGSVNTTIDHFQIQNGYSTFYGSGITNLGSLTLNDSEVVNNRTGNGGSGNAGGISSAGTSLTLNNSTVADNIGEGDYYGFGGIAIYTTDALTLNNSTVTGNQGGGIMLDGLYSSTQQVTTIINSTIANNTNPGKTGGGIYIQTSSPARSVTIRNSIIAGNTAASGPDCSGIINTSDHNIIGNTSGCTISSSSGDQLNVNPQISASPVGDPSYNALSSTSPAIDAGNSTYCPANDERGVTRSTPCDIGAYEYTVPGSAASFGIASGSNQTTAPGFAYSNPLAVYVLDSQGSPVSGVTVTFTAPVSGASGTFADTSTNTTNAISDINGLATSAIFTANSQVGTDNVTATASGLSGSVNFALTQSAWFVSPTGHDSNACSTSSAPCLTINGAIGKANSGDSIEVASGVYTTSGSVGTAIVWINKSVTILGGWDASFTSQSGMSVIDGGGAYRPIDVQGPGINDTLDHFVIQNSFINSPYFAAGAIFLYGNLTLSNSIIQSNQTAGIYFSGANHNLTLNDSTITNNVGGGINIESGSGGSLILNNSTISNNSAPIDNYGGGIYNDSTDPITINNSTLFQNTATQGGGIYNGGGAVVTIMNSILAGDTATTGPDCGGTITSSNHNIIGNTSGCTVTAGAGDQFNTNPQISTYPTGALQYHALLSSSPAIDAGNNATCESTDQRGVARPVGPACDIGAYEYTVPGPAASFGIASGTSQLTGPNIDFQNPLEIYVIDSQGSPANGTITVTFTAPASGASGTFADSHTNTTTAVTNAGGTAISTTLTANSQLGTYDVTATASGLSGSVNFAFSQLFGWYVSPTGNDSNACNAPSVPCLTINRAINHATSSGDSIIAVASGTYTASTSPIVRISTSAENIILSGGWDSTFTTQNGSSTIDGQNTYQAIIVDILTGVNATIDHFTIQNGNATSIYPYSLNGYPMQGGGISSAGNLTLVNSTVTGNASTNNGGGIDSGAGRLTIRNSTLNNNLAQSGGGIYTDGTQFTITNSTIKDNLAQKGGGGVYVNSGSPLIKNATINNNIAQNGGGVYVNAGTVLINNATISQNTVTTSTNTLALGGGIFANTGASVTASNTILSGNGAQNGYDCAGTITSAGHNLLGDNDGCNFNSSSGDLVGTQPNPINPQLGNLQNNGGGTFTQALLTGSPAINAGNNATCEATDQRGVARPVGPACDIGAYEGSATQTVTGIIKIFTDKNNSTALPGTFLCDQSYSSCTHGANPEADNALKYAKATYNFYINTFGRRSMDNQNMPILITIDYGTNYPHAFWNGSQGVYGKGYANADDILSGELTHGVTQYESNLFYWYQSGSINESFSDMWGEAFDQLGSPEIPPDPASAKWLLGEDITAPGHGPIRSFSNPPLFGDPDKMTSALYSFDPNLLDNGGVHTNVGIADKAVYLMVQGGLFNGITTTGLGWNKVNAIYYEAETNLLTSGSDYSDLYYALHQACANLTQTHVQGITLSNCQQVTNATNAVQMNAQPKTNYNPDAPLCPSGSATANSLSLFKDDFENGSAKWTFTGSPAHTWSIVTGNATSGTNSLWGDDSQVNANAAVAMATPVAIPAGNPSYLHFNQDFLFDFYGSIFYNGGVLEYSTNNGSTWTDAAPLFSAGKNYGGKISTSYGNPLAGKMAFVGTSNGYVSSLYNLSSLSGKSVKFRWRLGTNNVQSVPILGWFLDDVQINTCIANPAAPTLLSPLSGALVTSYTPMFSWKALSPTPDHYEIQVATTSTFSTTVVESNVKTTSFKPGTPLSPSSTNTYYWRVRAFNILGNAGGWSLVWSFRTPPAAPTLLSPVNGATVTSLKPLLDWSNVSGASSYLIQISKSSTFATILISSTVTASQYTPLINLPSKTKLYWRVQAKGITGTSAWSNYFSFSTP